MATPVKGDPVRVLTYRAFNGLSDIPVDCRGYNAVQVAVHVSGTSPSATITIEGSEMGGGGNFQALPDPNAVQRLVTADAVYEVNVGSSFAKVRIADIAGTFGTGRGFTVILTPYVSAGSRQRGQYYDRNPVPQLEQDESAYAPHGETERWSYTVPSGKRAYIETLFLYVRRTSVATTVGYANVYVRYLPAGGSQVLLLMAELYDNNMGANAIQHGTQFGLINPGDKLLAITRDTSMGGVINPTVSAKIIEFDL